MTSINKMEMFSIFENFGYKVTPLASMYDKELLLNYITRRYPKQNIYLASRNNKPKYCLRYMEQNKGGTAWMKIDVYAKELSHWTHNLNDVNKAILYLAGDFWQDTNIRNYWNKLPDKLSLPDDNLNIVDSVGLEYILENK